MTPREIIAEIVAPALYDVIDMDHAADEIIAALDKAGFAIVPKEPNIDMGLAGAEQANKHMRGPGAPADYDASMEAYRAMIKRFHALKGE